MDRIVKERKVDATLTVSSPITGLITARNAAPGLFVQPGNPPPVYIVADTSVMWMVANVPERQAADLRLGQEVRARVAPYPGRSHPGKIVTDRPKCRSEYAARVCPFRDRRPRLRSPRRYVCDLCDHACAAETTLAVPQDAVVREGDGSMTVWTTEDGHTFFQRVIKIGLSNDGFTEVLDGLRPGERVATGGSIFIANQYANAGN